MSASVSAQVRAAVAEDVAAGGWAGDDFNERAGTPLGANAKSEATADGGESNEASLSCIGKRSQEHLVKLLSKSPYVGFCRHAPPSPIIQFKLPSFDSVAQMLTFELESEVENYRASPSPVFDELWAEIFSYVAEVPLIPVIGLVGTNFRQMFSHPAVWQGHRVCIPPGRLSELGPVLDGWLAAWSSAACLVTPRSLQLFAQVSRRAPNLDVETAWYFDSCAKGEGVEVIRSGRTVVRVDEEDLVVLGNAPLVFDDDRPPYLEICLDELDDEPAGDGLNDFGIGVTACAPEDIEDLGAVADEVPCSWVVDFAQTSVCLSVNNINMETKGFGIGAAELVSGDRVGILVSPKGDSLKLFLNGILRETLTIPPEHHVPEGADLYPVLDLYGRPVQISRTNAIAPQV